MVNVTQDVATLVDGEGDGDSQSSHAKIFVVGWALALGLGIVGADRFYLGYRKLAILKLCTLGGLGFWAFIDVVELLSDRLPDAEGRLLDGYPENKLAAIAFTLIVWGVALTVLGVSSWLSAQ